MSNSTGDQLVSFFVYSLFIYPITNYIVSPSRKYARWKAAFYAVIFLLVVSILHLMYEGMEEGPNHYQLLGVTRYDGIAVTKRAYRTLSLEIHPDKNKAPTATEDFQRVKQAFDMLVDKDKRREYNRLGEAGVHAASQLVVDHRYLLVQLAVYYGSSLVLAFIMTISEPTGEAFSLSLFGLAVMLLIEMLLVVQEVPLPRWFMPHHSAHEVVGTMHKLFPAFMNGCRCISTAFYVDRKAVRVVALEAAAVTTRGLAVRAASLVRSAEKMVRVSGRATVLASMVNEDGSLSEGMEALSMQQQGEGAMEHALAAVRRVVLTSKDSDAVNVMIRNKLALIDDPVALQKQSVLKDNRTFELFRNLGLYLVARFVFIKTTVSS